MPRNIPARFPNRSEAAKKRWADPEYVKKQRETQSGKKRNISDENRKKTSDRVKANPPHKGHKHTEESKRLMSENRKGKATGKDNANFGKPQTEEQKKRQSELMKGKYIGENNPMYDIHLTGEQNHFYGKNHSEISKQKVSAGKQGIPLSDWNGYILPINQHVRKSHRYKKACMDAMKDADFKDAFTGVKGTRKTPIECHHKIPHNMIMRLNNIQTKEQADACDLLFDKHNLIVMLKSAHDKFHNLYGDDKNIYELTEEQIMELYT